MDKNPFNSLLALTQHSIIPIFQVSLQRTSVFQGFAQGDRVDILQITTHRDSPGDAGNPNA